MLYPAAASIAVSLLPCLASCFPASRDLGHCSITVASALQPHPISPSHSKHFHVWQTHHIIYNLEHPPHLPLREGLC